MECGELRFGCCFSHVALLAHPNQACWWSSWVQGVGVEWVTTMGRIDISLARVLKRGQHDRVSTGAFGLQFGFLPPRW